MNTTKKERHALLMKRIGAWIAEKRLERGMSRSELADDAGISEVRMGEFERIARGMRMATLFDMLYALDCTRDEVAELFEIDAELRTGGVS